MNVLYSVINLKKATLGPKTRISLFINEFKKHSDLIIEGSHKIRKSIKAPKLKTVYVETAPNRIKLVDLISLLILKIKSKKLIVFIRDVYIEMFPEEYQSFRKKITLWANKLSYYFLSLIADELVFPTKEMGDFFYQKNKNFPKRPYSALPPGTASKQVEIQLPDFNQPLGFLYLGSVSYKNSGFENFIHFARQYKDRFKFYVLSKDPNIQKYKKHNFIQFDQVNFNEIAGFIHNNNIAFGFHSRPRNNYDDITFPLKILDFINFRLPFVTDYHKPIIHLLDNDYPLFSDIKNAGLIYEKIEKHIEEQAYLKLVKTLDAIAQKNTYENRYQQIIKY